MAADQTANSLEYQPPGDSDSDSGHAAKYITRSGIASLQARDSIFEYQFATFSRTISAQAPMASEHLATGDPNALYATWVLPRLG